MMKQITLNNSSKDKFADMTYAYVSQFAAAPYVLDEMNNFRAKYNRKSILEVIYGTNLHAIGRGLCLPSATCTCLNALCGARQFDEQSIASMFRMLLPLHGITANNPLTQEPYPHGWQVLTDQGDMYYHAIQYWVNQATNSQVKAHTIVGYNKLEDLANLVNSSSITVALLLDNRFVIHWVREAEQEMGIQFIKQDDDGVLLINTQELHDMPFQSGRHAVSLLDVQNDHVLISDSFSLPGMTSQQTMRWWPIDVIAKYTHYQSELPRRAIIFTTDKYNSEVKNLVDSFGGVSASPKNIN